MYSPKSLATLTVLAIVLLDSAVFAADITGTISIHTAIRKRPTSPRKVPGHPQLMPPQREEDETTNVVVYLEKVDTPFESPQAHAVMSQRDKMFTPTVVPVVVGQTVDFPNYDPIFHNVYSDSKVARFDFPQYRNGQSYSRSFNKPGVVELFCSTHATMNGYVLVLQNPFFAQPDASHVYTIKDVPKGHYVLTAWHPRVEPQSHPVDIPAKGTVKVDFTL